MKYLLITDIPAPWREKVFEMVFRRLGDEFHVAYCKDNEKRRLWTFAHGMHPKTLFKAVTLRIGERERFCNFGVVPFLLKHRPRIVICFSLNPTIFLALLVCKLLGCRIIVFADTWLGRDEQISKLQRLARKIVYSSIVADAYLGASRKTLEMFQHYNTKAKADSLFQSALCADNEYFEQVLNGLPPAREFDFMFSGRIVVGKNPIFLAQVAAKLRERLGRCKVLVIGDGEPALKEQMFRAFEEAGVEYTFAGFVPHDKLPSFYSRAKLLLLPTSQDCWGVVINEAMVSGTPVVTTDRTAAAGELVLHGQNGFILPLDAELWANHVAALLAAPQRLSAFAADARATVARYRFSDAAEGILDAIAYVERLPDPHSPEAGLRRGRMERDRSG